MNEHARLSEGERELLFLLQTVGGLKRTVYTRKIWRAGRQHT